MSLVDKESMRKKLGSIGDKVKAWMKVQEMAKASAAAETIKAAIMTALAESKVGLIKLLYH